MLHFKTCHEIPPGMDVVVVVVVVVVVAFHQPR